VTALYTSVFKRALIGFPSEFRRHYADEMLIVFTDRCAQKRLIDRLRFTVVESVDAFVAGIQMRLSTSPLPHPALAASVVIAMIATTFALHDASTPPQSRIDFSAHDPGGAFTITILNGKPVAATMDRVPLPANRIIQEKDSIRILSSSGEVALAVAFDPARGSIAWNPRTR
jgi:hypothetical protein